MKQNYIYLATSENFNGARAVKIGETTDPNNRLAQYNNQLSVHETNAYYIAIFQCNDFIKTDHDLHNILKEQNEYVTWDGPKGSGIIPATEEAYILKNNKTIHDLIYYISTIINKDLKWKKEANP